MVCALISQQKNLHFYVSIFMFNLQRKFSKIVIVIQDSLFASYSVSKLFTTLKYLGFWIFHQLLVLTFHYRLNSYCKYLIGKIVKQSCVVNVEYEEHIRLSKTAVFLGSILEQCQNQLQQTRHYAM